MNIGIPKEIKPGEMRCAISPGGVRQLTNLGYRVGVQSDAGLGAGHSNEDYESAGAHIVSDAAEIYAKYDLIVKVKEPLPAEYPLIRPGQIVFGYFHFASSLALTTAMLQSGAYCFSFEMVQNQDGSLPLLTPMSEVAGRLSVLESVRFMQSMYGGKGKLITGLPGVLPGTVLIIGAGIAGTNAAGVAAGLGAEVILADIKPEKLREAEQRFAGRVKTLSVGTGDFDQAVSRADIIIGAALVPGKKAPIVLTDSQMQTIAPGTVLADIAIDQGGCFAEARATTLQDPVYLHNGLVRYAVPNMPGAVPRSASSALSNAVLPYLIALCKTGPELISKVLPGMQPALEIAQGRVLNPDLNNVFGWNV